MEPNVDRGMWAIVALLVAVVIGAAVMLIFPNFVGQIGNEMTELMTNPSMIINKGKTGENVVSDTDDDYILATDSMFSGDADGEFTYIGTEKVVRIPHVIKGVPVTSYIHMFNTDNGHLVEKVISDNTNVTIMNSMFRNSSATTLDLSSFDTSNVTDMNSMFYTSSATSLDLSSFDTSSVTSMGPMFYNSRATVGYARTLADADRFNASSNKPAGLTFVVK